jgi:hypothetical protein
VARICIQGGSDGDIPLGEESVVISQLAAWVAALDTRQAGAAAYRERTEQQVVVTAGDPTQVRITVVPNNASIVREFREADGTPATDLRGEVFATSGMGGAWRSTMINPDGTYELHVAAGTWHLEPGLLAGERTVRQQPATQQPGDCRGRWEVRRDFPAGALGVTGTVKLVVTPMVEELVNTLTARPFGYGYSIHAFDSDNRQVTSAFNQNVTISFYYTEDELRRRGVSEDDLSPAYFSTNTHSWTKVESFVVDKEANRITAEISHFSVWAMTSRQGGTFKVFLPLVIRN